MVQGDKCAYVADEINHAIADIKALEQAALNPTIRFFVLALLGTALRLLAGDGGAEFLSHSLGNGLGGFV